MREAENLRFVFSFDTFWLFLGAVLIAASVYFYYKRTLPPLSLPWRIVFILLRFSALFSILLLFFAPKAEYKTTHLKKPRMVWFFDNSVSIMLSEEKDISEKLSEFARKLLLEDNNFENEIYLFGDSVKRVSPAKFVQINIRQRKTNLENVIKKILEFEDSVSAVTIITDGAITNGANPVPLLKEITVPVNILALGEKNPPPNIEIKSVKTNSIAYVGAKVPVETTVFAEGGFDAQNKTLLLFENGKQIDKKIIEIEPGKAAKVKFFYTPKKKGKVKLTVKIKGLADERNLLDNEKSANIEILEKRKNILLVSDNPNYDVTFVKQAILSDTNFTVSEAIFFSKEKQPAPHEIAQAIKNSKAVFFVGFPSIIRESGITKLFSDAIANGKPYFIELTENVNFSELRKITKATRFEISGEPKTAEAQVAATETPSPFFEGIGEKEALANSLPPITLITNSISYPKYFSSFLQASINGIPINNAAGLYGTTGQSRSVILLASNIWRWKLQNPDAGTFDKFIVNITKWLTANPRKKQFVLRINKNVFAQTDEIEITAQTYNEFLEATNEAKISAFLTSGNFTKEIFFEPRNNGIFSAKLKNVFPGNYRLNAEAAINGKKIKASVSFKVTETDVEKSMAKRNTFLLKKIAAETRGKYSEFADKNLLLEKLRKEFGTEKIGKKHNFIFFPRQEFLFFIILLFTFEWILRKRKGLL